MASDPTKDGTNRAALREVLAPCGARSYTLEVSFYASAGGTGSNVVPYTPARYGELGKKLGLAIAGHV